MLYGLPAHDQALAWAPSQLEVPLLRDLNPNCISESGSLVLRNPELRLVCLASGSCPVFVSRKRVYWSAPLESFTIILFFVRLIERWPAPECQCFHESQGKRYGEGGPSIRSPAKKAPLVWVSLYCACQIRSVFPLPKLCLCHLARNHD